MSSLIKSNWLDLKEADIKTRSLYTRFAPSPSGYLHLGHVLHLIYLWTLSKRLHARIILRSEDHDRQRSREEFFAAIAEDLNWLGFLPAADLGLSKSEFLTQASDLRPYKDAMEKLTSQGLCYACDCSRPQIAARLGSKQEGGEEIPYDSFCAERGLAFIPGKTCLRLRVAKDFTANFSDIWLGEIKQKPAEQCGDFTLIDKRGNFSYQLANVVDDARQGINLIIRGLDILPSTGRQLYLRKLLNTNMPQPIYAHHPLLMEEDGKQKLSKRQHSQSIRQMREGGVTAEEVLAKALVQGGLADARLKRVSLEMIFISLTGL